MQIIPIYRYEREGGGVTVSPTKPEGEFTELCRIVADEGKRITKDGETFYSCIDTDSAEGWREEDDPNYIPTETLSDIE